MIRQIALLMAALLLCCVDARAEGPMVIIQCDPPKDGQMVCLAMDTQTGNPVPVVIPVPTQGE